MLESIELTFCNLSLEMHFNYLGGVGGKKAKAFIKVSEQLVRTVNTSATLLTFLLQKLGFGLILFAVTTMLK